MQRNKQLMIANDDFLVKEIAEDLVIVKHADDYDYEKELLVEAIEDFTELIRRRCPHD